MSHLSTFLAAALARGFNLDPTKALPYAAPGVLVIPLLGLLILILGVRTRRSAAFVGLVTVVLTMADLGLITWARFRNQEALRYAYQWINTPVSFSGDPRFQGFGVDLAIRLDHVTLVAALVVAVIFLAVLSWHRAAGRGEQGPIRFQVNALFLLLSALGVIVSGDLAELAAFWFAAGLATYLLLSQRWGSDVFGRASRFGLALPLLGDMALLSAISLFYSRAASLDLDRLQTSVRTTPGVGLKFLSMLAVLIVLAVAVRAAIWPFTAWQTATTEQPPSLWALVLGVWPVLAGVVLYRWLPVITQAGPQVLVGLAAALALAAILGPVLSLLAFDLRRAVQLASSGAVAAALLAMLSSMPPQHGLGWLAAGAPRWVALVGLVSLFGAGMARAGLGLVGGGLALRYRSPELQHLGAGWQRLPGSTAGMIVALLTLSLAAFAAPALQPSTALAARVVFGLALLLAGLGVGRVYSMVAHGAIPRRRGFEPSRVREMRPLAMAAGLLPAGLALVAQGLLLWKPWLGFLGAGTAQPDPARLLIWLLPGLVGFALAAALVFVRRAQAMNQLRHAGAAYRRLWAIARLSFGRFFSRPALELTRLLEVRGLPVAEAALGRALVTAGLLAGRRLSLLRAGLAVLAVLALGFALLTPGVRR
ncbi:MAG: hypothetical protein JF888_14630 [Candidatus Dormibacteraeota bacterium]|uniref:NADH:quinone oxidoreductase/Mrp antiporter transmembrane domain-containing protein n=1 Tax=Candidatus Dormiibacter inghamiae TaxID=3127013 RepID=A0A934NDB7_9BACT|nr:hypothetical protein [Candidatus Dormibacteraeota bacterium]MBJ7604858.1 hypothetical protein [Candidatus Dormibacteraeota bacterium]